MNNARMRELIANQTGVARKTYIATPIGEKWTLHQIIAEIGRTGPRVALDLVKGCLQTLCEVGLVREHPPGMFQRVPFKAEAVKEKPPVSTKPATTDPLVKLGDLATTLRGVASELESLALELSERSTVNAGELEKLKAFKELLRTL